MEEVQVEVATPSLLGEEEEAELPPAQEEEGREDSLEQRYELQELIGKGPWGEVRGATHKTTGIRRAVKSIEKKNTPVYKLFPVKEVALLQYLCSPHLVRVRHVFESDTHYHIVEDLLRGSLLTQHLEKDTIYNETTIVKVLKQILQAIVHLHDNHLTHGNLKPRNLHYGCVSEGGEAVVKVSGFPNRVFLGKKLVAAICNTKPEFLAPEVLFDKECGPAADMWSLGVVSYQLLTGDNPFTDSSKNMVHTFERILKANYHQSSSWTQLSTGAKEFVQQLLSVDSSKRPSAKQALAHYWINVEEEQGKEHLGDAQQKLSTI